MLKPDGSGAKPPDQATENDDLLEETMPYEDGNRLIVVGIGSSAGGLEALTEFVSHLKPTGRLSFIIAQHLSPTHRSMLEELLSRDTGLPIKRLKHSVKPAPDTIYMTPPNHHVIVEDGKIRLIAPGEKRGPVPSADRLFSSLAREYGEYCGAIVLSGTGSDGSAGIAEVKKAGGFTGAQDYSAAYDGMPLSARNTYAIDLVARPSELAEKFIDLAAGTYVPPTLIEHDEHADIYDAILGLLRTQTRHDFSEYRPPTILRRIARRTTLLGIADHEAYIAHLKENSEEVEALCHDLMIGVTSFFRDQEQFAAAARAIETLVAGVTGDREIRAWSPGCSTGEESYSIAILLMEAVREAGKKNPVRVFATDINARGLAAGRRGRYPAMLDEIIPRHHLERYFRFDEDGYQVSQSLRDAVVFSLHNVIHDPRFPRSIS